MIKAIICDLDGTLCNDDHRKEAVKDIVGVGKWGEEEYNRYYSLMHQDTPFSHIKEILTRFVSDHEVIYITGRPERFRKTTEEWLLSHCSVVGPLFMRPDNDYRCDTELKTEIFNKHVRDTYHVNFVLEDRTRVVKMWRELGIPCLQVQQSDY